MKIEWTEEDLASWEQLLDAVEERIWPVFERRGYDRNAMLLAFLVNGLTNVLDPEEEEREPWE